MSHSKTLAAAAAFFCLGQVAQASDILGACEEDINMYCADVEPGHGRISACLYAHEDKVSEACDAAMGDTADMIDLVFERLRYVKQQCREDLQSHCGDVKPGQGRFFTCLAEQRDELSESCAGVIDDVELPSG